MENRKKFFAEILSWIIGIIGIISTVLCSVVTGDSDFAIIYVVVVALETVLTIIAIWHICIKYNYEAKFKRLKEELADKDKKNSELIASNLDQKTELEKSIERQCLQSYPQQKMPASLIMICAIESRKLMQNPMRCWKHYKRVVFQIRN